MADVHLLLHASMVGIFVWDFVYFLLPVFLCLEYLLCRTLSTETESVLFVYVVAISGLWLLIGHCPFNADSGPIGHTD